MRIALSFIALVASARVAASEPNAVTVKTGVEYGLVLGVGYARQQHLLDRTITFGGELAIGAAGLDPADFRAAAGGLVPLVDGARWRVLGGVAASARGTHNDLGHYVAVGADVAVHAGRYAPRGFIALELGLDTALATHVTHSDDYRMLVYDDAKTGWYQMPGAMLRAGLQGGVTLGRHDVILRAGRLLDLAGHPATVPIYGTLAFATRW